MNYAGMLGITIGLFIILFFQLLGFFVDYVKLQIKRHKIERWKKEYSRDDSGEIDLSSPGLILPIEAYRGGEKD